LQEKAAKSVNFDGTASKYMNEDLYKDPDAGVRYQEVVLDPLKKKKAEPEKVLTPLEIMLRNQL